MTSAIDLKKYFQSNRKALVEKFRELLAFQTVSALPSSKSELKSCAKWLEKYLKALGGKVEVWGGKGAPIVFANFPSPNKNAPTVLIYNHYDVQPVDPLEEWAHPPFEAALEGDTVFARGAQDNKGQCLFVLIALEAMKGSLPCSVKVLIEGEEENGSSLLSAIAKEKAAQLRADYTMILDVGMRTNTTPAITLGRRGLTSLTHTVRGPNQDLHSGLYGGVAQNPLHALVSMLSSLRNPDGSIAVPGFYDEVKMPSTEETSLLSLDFDERTWEKEFGQSPSGGESSFPPAVRNWLRPTLEINGIHGGYGGEGTKTVIPREASAKISCRLVPHQDPATIAKRVNSFLLKSTPQGITTDVTIHEGMGKATRTSASSLAVKALFNAMESVWNKKPEFILDGASIPISPLLEEVSGGELVMWGLGLPSDRIHAPNEHFSLDRIEKGFLTLCLTLQQLGKTKAHTK